MYIIQRILSIDQIASFSNVIITMIAMGGTEVHNNTTDLVAPLPSTQWRRHSRSELEPFLTLYYYNAEYSRIVEQIVAFINRIY